MLARGRSLRDDVRTKRAVPCAPSTEIPTSMGTGPQHCSLTAAYSQTQLAPGWAEEPDAKLRVHNIPGGASFKVQLKKRWEKKSSQPKPAPVSAPVDHKGRKRWMKEQGFSASLLREAPIFNLRRDLICSTTGLDITGKTPYTPSLLPQLGQGAVSTGSSAQTPQSHLML